MKVAFARAFANDPNTGQPLAVRPSPVMAGITVSDVEAARAYHISTAGSGVAGDALLKRSPDSAAMIDYWDKTDAIIDGIDVLRLAGEKYLPKFSDEPQSDYNFRLRMTKLTNIYRDTVEGLAAKPFEQEITLIHDENKPVPKPITDFIEDVDGSGNNLTVFASATFFNGINSAIDWIFVDYDKPDPTVRTLADAKEKGVRPYWSHVLGRNILEARSAVIGGKELLTKIRIFEPGTVDQIRAFERLENGSIVWELRKKGNDWIDAPGGGQTQFALADEGTIPIAVIPLVPFVTGRRDGRSWRFFPAMRDAADLQIELYQQESGLKFAKTLAAYPMLAGNGVKPLLDAEGKPVKLAVGPGRVLYAPTDANGNAGSWTYVEPSATSLTFLAADIKETIGQLRELARQPLTAQSGNITVINSAVAAGKAKSAVKAWALMLKDALENAFKITTAWMNIRESEYAPQVNVFTEFDEFLEGKDLEDLNTMRKNGDLSQETYWEEKRRRGVLSPEFDKDVERERLLTELPGDGEELDANGNPIVPPVA